MFKKDSHPYLDSDGIYRQISFPFRIERKGLLSVAFQLIFSSIAAIMTFGFIQVALLLFGIHFVPTEFQDYYASTLGVLVLASIPVSWTYKRVRTYDSTKECFSESTSLLGRALRLREWPKCLFSGITYGRKGIGRGMVGSVVRLKCSVDGYLLDSIFYANNSEEAKIYAHELSSLSGLPVLGEEHTGSQHDHNDLRRNAWVVTRYGGSTKRM